ncbi:MAG TPA: LLM class F420-dependent oxidoreductase [Candidatus Dormibacteraeota bacterium]|jgi:F420-dependent oxidoreductase-like protein|nr:LLM class F420-dependent oxidoreductase [Candidatus Dormibacteraeota bacterium]
MRYIGLHIPNFSFADTPARELFPTVRAIAQTAEESGFTAVSVMDHFHQIAPQGDQTEPMLESYTTLGALAASTSRVRLLTLVAGITYHNPAHLAKEVTTLDVISQGRAILGVGAGWFEEEHRAYGFEYPALGRRLDRLEDALPILRSMFDNPSTTHHGKIYEVEGALNIPRPIQERIPILVGGGGERRTLRLVARYGDLCNVLGDPSTLGHKLEVLRGHCEAEGRDISTITTTTHAGIVVIDSDEEGVERRLRALHAASPPALRGLTLDELRERTISGTPDRVTERLRQLIGLGYDGFTFSVFGANDVRLVRLAGEAAGRAFE